MESRILFAYIGISSGHKRAAEAISKTLKKLDNQIVTRCVDSFSFAGFVITHIVTFLYIYTIKRKPELWGYLYDNTAIKGRTKKLRSVIEWVNSVRFYFLLKRFKPSVIVCTQAIPCGIVSNLKKRGKINVPLVAVVTDFEVHTYWIYPEVDIYTVAREEMKSRLIKEGIAQEKIKVVGIPIEPSFNDSLNRKELYLSEGFSQQLKTVLVMGGSRGLGKIEETVSQLYKVKSSCQVIVIAGNNKKLKRQIDKFGKKNKSHMKVYGYINHLNEVMEMSDLIITKPGGMTSSEALAKGLPMLIVNPIPGQEERNSKFLVENGAAIQVHDINKLSETVDKLINDPELLDKMKQSALRLAKPTAAEDISKIVLDLSEYNNKYVFVTDFEKAGEEIKYGN